MAEAKKAPSAISAYKAGFKEGKGKPRKKSNTQYFGIGRTLSALGGTGQMVNIGNVQKAYDNLKRGDLQGMLSRLAGLFDVPTEQYLKGVKTIATGQVIGKVLDKTNTNPRVKAWAGFGIKLW